MDDVENETREVVGRIKELTEQAKTVRSQRSEAEQQLAAFDTQEGQQMNKLENTSRDTAAAWKWIQDHMEVFEKTVYGPPIVSCSLKDQKYANVVEAGVGKHDFLAITVQTKADHKKLSDQLFGAMKLADVTIRKNDEDNLPGHPSISQNDMHSLGLDGWVSGFIDGPIPVLSMLCFSAKINTTAVGLHDSSEDQHNRIVGSNVVRSWNTGRTASRVARRAEYGPGATSTSTRPIMSARFWTDQPVDSNAKRGLEEKMEVLDAEFENIKQEVMPLRSKVDDLKSSMKEIKEAKVSSIRRNARLCCLTLVSKEQIQNEKAELQKLQGEQRALPRKIGQHFGIHCVDFILISLCRS